MRPARIRHKRPKGPGEAPTILAEGASNDFREISPELQQIRGPYQIAVGIAAYERHVSRYHRRHGDHHSGRAGASRHALTAPG